MPRTKFAASAALSSANPGICHMPTFMRFLVPLLFSELSMAGCSSMKPYTDSPQYDEYRNRFEHPAGYSNDKGLFDAHGLAGAFLTLDDDPAEKNGMPLIEPAKVPPANRDGRDVTFIGDASLLFAA